jgi:hypothetical protein
MIKMVISPNVPTERTLCAVIYLPTRRPYRTKIDSVPKERLVGRNESGIILRSVGTFGNIKLISADSFTMVDFMG